MTARETQNTVCVCIEKHFSIWLLLILLSFIMSVMFFKLLFSLRRYDLLPQRGYTGSASGHIIRALCFALSQHQNMIEPWVRRLCCIAQREHCNPCFIVLTRAVNIVSGGLALKTLTYWFCGFKEKWKQKNPNTNKKQVLEPTKTVFPF